MDKHSHLSTESVAFVILTVMGLGLLTLGLALPKASTPKTKSVIAAVVVSEPQAFSPTDYQALRKQVRTALRLSLPGAQYLPKSRAQKVVAKYAAALNPQPHVAIRTSMPAFYETVVAIIDTGIDPEHPDLKDHLWHKPGTDEYGWDFVRNTKNPIDRNGHGTHVAGLVIRDQKIADRFVSLPKIKLMILKYYHNFGYGTEAQNIERTVQALNYAIDNGAQVINYSSSGWNTTPAEFAALKRAADKGIMVVVAAGNEGEDLKAYPHYPANYANSPALPNFLAVGNLDRAGHLNGSSNYSPEFVSIAAPGSEIHSTFPTSPRCSPCYSYMSGTSQAAPRVTSAIARLLSFNPQLTITQIRAHLLKTADQDPALEKAIAGGRKLNFDRVEMERPDPSLMSEKDSGDDFRMMAQGR